MNGWGINPGPQYSASQIALAKTCVAVADLQSALLEDEHALEEFRPVLEKVAKVAEGVRNSGGRPIDLSDLGSSDPKFVILALSNLVSPKSHARHSLPLLTERAPALLDLGLPVAPPIVAKAGETARLDVPWQSSWHNGRLTAANIMASGAAVLAHRQKRSQSWLVKLGWQMGASMATGLAGAYASYVRLCQPSADRALTRRALQGQIGIEDYRAYYRQISTFGLDASLYPTLRSAKDVTNAELIAEFSVTDGEPAFSGRRIAWRMFKNFQKESGFVSIGQGQFGDRLAFDKMGATAGLSLLNCLGSRLHVVHPERLEEVKGLVAQGKKVIFHANHRSDLDTLALCALLRGCMIRNVAKDALAFAPGLGQTPVIHPLAAFNPFVDSGKRWRADAPLHSSILIDRSHDGVGKMIDDCMAILGSDEPESVLINPGATRHKTPIAGVEAGMLPPRGGISRLLMAAHERWGDEVYLVPVMMAGVGSIMSSDYSRLLRYGVGINRTIVMGVGTPYRAGEILDELADSAFANVDPAKRAHFINSRIHARLADGLLKIQRGNRTWPGEHRG